MMTIRNGLAMVAFAWIVSGAAVAQPRPTPAPAERPDRRLTDALGPTDRQLALEVRSRVSQLVGIVNLNVGVADGIATLEGTVERETDRLRAESLARGIEGVRRVRNQIRVAASGALNAAPRTDTPTLEAAVAAALRYDPGLAERDIRVVADVDTNTVTLLGEVASEDERERAFRIASGAFEGEVRNRLSIPSPSPLR